jgi:hypothetical protein
MGSIPAPNQIDELIDVLLKRAPELQAAGYTSISIGELSATFGPPPAPPTDMRGFDVSSNDSPPPPLDPLQDPATYPGGRVPGFQRPKKSS